MTSVVQSLHAATNSGTGVNVVLGATPTVGNLLVATVTVNGTPTSPSYPWGATADLTNLTGSRYVGIFSKIAGASESTTIGFSNSTTFSGVTVAVVEFAPTAGSTWTALDTSATANSGATNVVTLTIGPTATQAADDNAAVAVMGLSSSPGGGQAWSDSFTMVNTVSSLNRGYTGYRVLAGNSAISTTGTISGTRAMAGLIATYRQTAPTPSGSTGGGTWTYTGAGSGIAPALTSPLLLRRVVGTTGLIRTVTDHADSVRLKIGTNSAVTAGVVWTSAVSPTSGRALHDTTGLGLTPGGEYFFRVEMTDDNETILDSGAVGRLVVPRVGVSSFSFSFGSCTDFALMPGGQTDSLALGTIAGLTEDLFIHLGDLWYDDGAAITTASYRTHMTQRMDASAHSVILSTRPSTYTPSDHDAGMANDSNGTNEAAALASFNTVYREMWPAPAPASGVYYAFTWGRVRFIQLDGRTFKSPQGATDNAGKTLLGATQKQWLKDEITNTDAALFIIAQDVPWIGAAEASNDGWMGYTTERAELGAHFIASTKNIAMLAGDMHAAAYHDGASGSVGNIPLFHGSPFLTNASRRGGPYTAGPIPAAGTAISQHYGHVDIIDDGITVTMNFEARNHDGTVLLSGSNEFDAPAPADAVVVAVLPRLTSTATADVTVTATSAAVLPRLTSTATADVIVAATATAVLPRLTSTALIGDADPTAFFTAAAVLPRLISVGAFTAGLSGVPPSGRRLSAILRDERYRVRLR